MKPKIKAYIAASMMFIVVSILVCILCVLLRKDFNSGDIACVFSIALAIDYYTEKYKS